jgi:hypothetical protein
MTFCAGPNELKLQITISSDKSVLELKQAIAAKSDVEADRQRLIYSGAGHRDLTLGQTASRTLFQVVF